MRLITSLIFAVCIAPNASNAEPPKVVTDIPAVHSLTQLVLGQLGEPALLVQGISDPHHMQLRPSQVRAISQANLVFWIGPDLTPWLQSALDNKVTGRKDVALMETPGTTLRDFEGEPDPHVWLDPNNALLWLAVIADALMADDPVNAATYQANAAIARDQITAVSDRVAEMLVPIQDVKIIAAHDAFGYFADRFSLSVVATLADSDATDTSAAKLTALNVLIQAGDIGCVFSEPNQDPELAQTLVRGTDTKIGLLDPTGALLPVGAALYADLLQNLARNIADCVLNTP